MTDYRKSADRKRYELKPWRRWYNLKRWKLRRAIQMKVEPLCRLCKARGMSRPAHAADHVIPHRGNPDLFWKGELQSLCKTCHDSAKQREEREGFSRDIDGDGWPVDPRHPFNRRT